MIRKLIRYLLILFTRRRFDDREGVSSMECKQPTPAESPVPIDDFQKRLLGMSPEEIRRRLYSLPFDQLQQVLLNLRPVPPIQKTIIKVVREKGKPPTDLDIQNVNWRVLKATEQVAWTCPDGKLEIRFDPALSPFGIGSFLVPQGAKAYSGAPNPKRRDQESFRYLVLVTTPDGFLLKKEASIAIERRPKAAK